MVVELNEKFGRNGIRFSTGSGGLPKATLTSAKANAEIYLHGAHVTHFQPNAGEPVLWMSDLAVFDGRKAIRGGIPVIFPWFGSHPNDESKPQHGFARNSSWNVAGASADGSNVTIELSLSSSPVTKQLWPYEFALKLTVTLSDKLHVRLRVENKDSEPFEVSPALHSYFAVADIRQVSLSGFEDTPYIDQLGGGERYNQAGLVKFSEEVDRVYLAQGGATSTRPAIVDDAVGNRRIEVSSEDRKSVV